MAAIGTGTRRRLRALLLTLLGMLPGCAALAPREVGTAGRLDALPRTGLALQRPVTIRWNDHLVPWIEAETDTDLAFALGLVHGHLRGAQIALLRMVARGRLSEVAGVFARDIDHALRILDFGRAAPAIEAGWPAETRDFVGAFLAGLNHAATRGPAPPEFGLLGLSPEPYTAGDMLAIGRLAGTDINWFSYFSLLAERGRPGFARLWQRTLEAGAGLAEPGEQADPRRAALGAILVRAVAERQQRGGGGALAQRLGRGAAGLRPASRPVLAESVARRRDALAVLSRGRDDGAGAAHHRPRAQSRRRLGRDQPARRLLRPVRRVAPAALRLRGDARRPSASASGSAPGGGCGPRRSGRW